MHLRSTNILVEVIAMRSLKEILLASKNTSFRARSLVVLALLQGGGEGR